MKLSLAIQTPEVVPTVPVALLSGTLREKLAKAARLEVEGVELMTADPEALDAKAILRDLREEELEAAAIGSGAVAMAAGLTLLHPDAAVSAQAESRLRGLIRFAEALEAPLVTIGSFRGRVASVGERGRERLVECLRRGAEYARERGVRLALEPVNRYESDIVNTADEGLALLNEVGHDHLGLLLDTYHVNIEESSWSGPIGRAMAAKRLWHVHIGDNNRLPPGQGMIDFASVVRALRKHGYEGYLSAELLARPDPDTAAEYTVAHMRPLIEA